VIGIGVTPRTLEVQLHDTYYILNPGILNPLLFLFLVFLTYLIKEGIVKYSRAFPNWILMVVSLALATETFALIRLFHGTDSLCESCPTYGRVFTWDFPWAGTSLLLLRTLGIIALILAIMLTARNIQLIRHQRK
jgi:hypothetical protein